MGETVIDNQRPGIIRHLLTLHEEKQSGVLRFEQGTTKKQLVLRNGRVAFAESNLSEEHLASILVSSKQISRSFLPKITSLIKGGKATDEALLSLQKLSPVALEEAARAQAVTILASLFSWETCEPQLYAGTSLTYRHVSLGLAVPQLIVLAARHAAAQRPQPAPFQKLPGSLLTASDDESLLLKLPLDSAEAYVYSLARDSISFEAIMQLVPPSNVKSEELIIRLLLLGLLNSQAPKKPEVQTGISAEESEIWLLEEKVAQVLIEYEVANHYEVLTVPVDASEQAIKDAYHLLAREFHPDRFQSAKYTPAFRAQVQKLFTYITGAYTVLSDQMSRAAYDEKRIRETGQLDAAQAARKGVDLEKERMAEALYRVGRTHLAKGELEEAVSHLKEAVWSKPNVARYQLYLGIAQSEVPRFRKDAESHLLKAVELDPVSIDGRIALAKLYIRVNLHRRAEARLREVLHWDADHSEANQILDAIRKGDTEDTGVLSRLKRPAPD